MKASIIESSVNRTSPTPMAGVTFEADVKDDALTKIGALIARTLDRDSVAILPPMDILSTLSLVEALEINVDTTMLDPWYNKGFGGIQEGYLSFFLDVIERCGAFSKHVYFWGFPEIVAPFVERIPSPLTLTCWLTWYYKNNPSVIRGWRSAQNACLHLSRPGGTLYPQRFLNDKQLALQAKGKLRYMPGPTSVLESGPEDLIEQPLLVGFVGRSEQTGHPSQKPLRVYDHLYQMAVSDGGLVLDPMAGSGTSAIAARNRGFRALLCDGSDEYTRIMEDRIGVKRLEIADELLAFFGHDVGDRNSHLYNSTVKPVSKGKNRKVKGALQSSIF